LPPNERMEFLQDDNEFRFYLTESIQPVGAFNLGLGPAVTIGTNKSFDMPTYFNVSQNNPVTTHLLNTGITISEPTGSPFTSSMGHYVSGADYTASYCGVTVTRGSNPAFSDSNQTGFRSVASLNAGEITVNKTNVTASVTVGATMPQGPPWSLLISDFIDDSAVSNLSSNKFGAVVQMSNRKGSTVGGGQYGILSDVYNVGPTTAPHYAIYADSTTANGGAGLNVGVRSAANGAAYSIDGITGNYSFYGPAGNIMNTDTYTQLITTTRQDVVVSLMGVLGVESSDERLKTNIVTITGSLEKVKALRGVYFDWRESGSNDAQREIGFISQEVNEVIPEIGIAASGSYVSGSFKHEYGYVKYKHMTAVLVEAIKEQQTIIENLTTRIATLESGSS